MAKRSRSRPGRSSRPIWPLLLVGLGLVMIAGSAVWFLSNQNGGQTAGAAPTAPGVRIPFPDIERVSLEDARAAYESGSAVFVDTRGEPWFSQQHIPGAVSVPYDAVEQSAGSLNRDDWIITYCT